MVLRKSHDQVMLKIQEEIAALGENERGIISDPYTGKITFDSTLLLSQYSASKGYQEISVPDLVRTVSAAQSRLFTYQVKSTESRDEEGNTTVINQYSVQYAGDSYFADKVFRLDEKGKELAKNYASNLVLYLGTDYSGGTAEAVSPEVMQYAALIKKYAEQYGIASYFDVICAVMMVESGGLVPDVMQSSQCEYNTQFPQEPNGITDPEYSIDCGVRTLAECLRLAGCEAPTDTGRLSLALQGYNFGKEYIAWALERDGGYSEENAIAYSDKMKNKLGLTVYGNPRYVPAVLQYYFPPGVGKEGWGSPFVGRGWRSAVTSEFGYRIDPITGEAGAFHAGVDIAYPEGTPINAVKGGIVTKAVKSDTGYGWHIEIDHGDGSRTLYGHCSKLLVSQRQAVSQGEVIALVGRTGRVTGAHLHLNVYINGELQNPRDYVL